ncbi:uncharacterized protein TNCV_4567871 [Trichonephila clavipes]|nr:uncharacterized protein TNCV_4567871 [Trichonephila clavipes]
MVKSIARKCKRQFYCNKFTNTSKNNSTSAVPESTASCSMLGIESLSTAEEMPGPVFGNRIVDLELIVEAFAQLCCPKCFAEKVELFKDSRYGLCFHFTLKCSSSKMEIVGASRIFLRSEKNRRLRYFQYYGEGDSKAFVSVKDTYGLNSVTKFECIGHVQKRVGSRLRKGKLTDNFIDRLQNYYGIAVRSNVGNLNAMQQNVIAALYHCASSDKKPKHGQSPIGKESWCYFQRGVANGTKCSTKYAGLSNDDLNKIKPVYLELCDKQILNKCLHGHTQNANECFNGIVWQKVPKEVFVSLKTVKFGSYDAIIHFNEGLNGCLKVFNKMNKENPGVFTLRGYKHLDKCRIREAIHNADPKTKKNRKILRALKKKKISVLEVKDGENYKLSAF